MRNKLLVFVASALVVAGCSNQQAVPVQSTGSTSQGHHAGPFVRQKGEQPVNWREFAWVSTASPYYPTILTGRDGAMWMTDYSATQLIRMTMDGTARQGALLTSFNPTAMTIGSDNKFYVGSRNIATIDTVTTGGVVSSKAIPSGDVVSFNGMTLGPDGNVWFTEASHVGKITPALAITEFAYKDSTTNNYLDSIVTGPDGNLWVSEYFAAAVLKIVPGTGAMTSFALGCNGSQIVSAKGDLYVSCTNNTLVQVTTAGVVTPLYNPYGFSSNGALLTIGPDGNPWFGATTGDVIGEFDPGTGQMTYYYPPTNYGVANALTLGPDGNMWTVDGANRSVQVYILNVISVSPTSLTLTAPGKTANIVVTQPGTTAWTASSTSTAIAKVAQGSPADTFTVTAVAKGQCKIIVTDSVGNSFPVHVTVQ
jgi:virginiamycin B lyase